MIKQLDDAIEGLRLLALYGKDDNIKAIAKSFYDDLVPVQAECERLQGHANKAYDECCRLEAQRDRLRGALETIVAEYKDRYQLLDSRFAFHSGKGDLTMEQRSTHSSKVAAARSIYKGVIKDISAALAETE